MFSQRKPPPNRLPVLVFDTGRCKRKGRSLEGSRENVWSLWYLIFCGFCGTPYERRFVWTCMGRFKSSQVSVVLS